MSAIYRANDKYGAKLTSTWISSPADGDLKVSAVPQHVPTIVVVGYNTDFETVFTVEGKTGDSYYNYTLTGVTRLRGYDDDIPVDTTVNCLNNEEFFNQFVSYMGIEWKGEWDIATSYSAGEGVSYNGSSYVALVDDTGTEPPSAGVWNLVNKRGATWTYGSGVPDNGDGDNEDFYLDVTNNDIYVKESDVWGVVTNIKGDTGAQGIQGEQGIAGGTDPASLTDGTFIEDTTNTDSYAGNTVESITAYETGLIVNLKVTNANTGASTLNIDSLGAKSIKINVSDDTPAGQIKAGQVIPLIYDGVNFQVVGGGSSVDPTEIINLIYPVGSIFITTVSANPGTYLGGTWEAFGAGRTLVGLDSGQTEFDTVEETGGAKTHTLQTTEMPAHTHIQDAHTHIQNAHGHRTAINFGGSQSLDAYDGYSYNTVSRFYNNSEATTATNQNTTATNQNTGGGGAHNNLQPYIVTYMWKRTA